MFSFDKLSELVQFLVPVYLVAVFALRRRSKSGGSEWREPTLMRLFIFLLLTLGVACFAWYCATYVRTHTGDIGAYLPLFGALLAAPLAAGLALSALIEAVRFVFWRNR